MLNRDATKRAGITGVFALTGLFLAACMHEPQTLEVLGAEERDTSWKASRQVIVSVDERGGLAWEGKPVSREELDTLLREAAMISPDLLLVVRAASADTKLENSVGVVTDVYRMARAYRINVPAGVIGGAAE